MAAQTWSSLQTSLLVMLSQAPSPYNQIPADFAVLYPQATSYAEGRIYQELVPLNYRKQNTSLVTTPASRTLNLTFASQTVLSVEGFALIIPSGTTNPALGTRIIYDPSSLDVIDMVWPQESVTVAPEAADWIGRYWALLDDQTLVFAPTVPAVYTAVITGDFEPVPISPTNPSTYLSSVYPELLQAACMVWLSGALTRNFGAQADDPRQAMSWETQYKTLLGSSLLEEQRRRLQGVGWSQNAPAPLNKPDRN